MGVIPIYRDNTADSTVISNVFIDEYLKDANDAQIKIYLYLARMMSAGLPTSIDEMADRFNHTEKDVVRALRYWESKGLLVLQSDAHGNITGIRLCTLQRRSMPSEAHRVISIEPLLSGTAGSTSLPEDAAAPGTDPGPQAPAVGNPAAESGAFAAPVESEPKPSDETARSKRRTPSGSASEKISPEQLEEFRSQEENRQLILIAEQYIGKPLSVSEAKTLYYISNTLHFSVELIDYLIEYCVGLGKKDFRYIEKVALNWATEGITTTDAARRKAASPPRRRTTSRRSARANAFNQFEQNSYDFETLEGELLKQ